MIIVRPERLEDVAAIRHVVEEAFGRPQEADLVDRLRRRGAYTLSLVAVEDDQIVGHILFTPVTVTSGDASFEAVALGPMAVLPSHQRRGVGSRMIRAGLEECRRGGQDVVVVLGHPTYYPRFGFKPSRPLGIRWEHDVPEEVFMVAELREGALAGRDGVVNYQPEFTSV